MVHHEVRPVQGSLSMLAPQDAASGGRLGIIDLGGRRVRDCYACVSLTQHGILLRSAIGTKVREGTDLSSPVCQLTIGSMMA